MTIQMDSPALRRGETAATALAAFAAVLGRRSARDRVAVECRAEELGDAARGVITVDLAADPAFEELVDQVAGELERLRGEQAAAPAEPADPVAGVAHFHAAVDEVVVAGSFGLDPVPPGAVFTEPETRDPRTAAALEAAVSAALRSGARDPRRRVSELELVADEGLPRLLALGRADRRPPRPRAIHELIAEQAARIPDAPAVVQGQSRLSYRQLDAEADRLAAGLRAHGVERGDLVGVLQPRSTGLIVTLLAILKAGAAYLVLEPDDPPARQERLLLDARPAAVLYAACLRERAPRAVRALGIEELAAEPGPATAAAVPSHPDDLAYVSYTSGSTGEPRGVAVTHRAVSRLVREPNWIELRPDDVFLQLAPVAFDASTLEIWTPLAHGCRLAVAPAGALEVDQLAAVLKEEGVSVLWLTAGLFHTVAATRPSAFEGVRHLVAGGDVIAPDSLARLLAACPGLTFTNGYGPTENTTFTACWTTDRAPAGPVPIGGPITGTEVRLLDAALRPVPEGVPGELHAAGDGLAAGYLHRPAATADRFRPDPYASVPGGRMYRTGDLARWRPDGALEFLGRVDQQLKIQGFRVEPGTVEAELTALPEVREAVVVAQADEETGGKRLLAYVVLDEDHPQQPDAGARIRERMRAGLPAYMVPWAVLVRAELPLNRNGKVDRAALPTASRVPRNVWNDYVAPRTDSERRLAELWGEVLRIEPVGVEDDFFDLGGHSLLVAELLGTLKDVYGREIPARVLYLQPTIAELAAELEG